MDDTRKDIGDLETTYGEDNISDGDLATTHENELMPETTLEEKMDNLEQEAEKYKLKQSLEDCQKEIEGYHKQILILSGDLEVCKEKSIKLDEELAKVRNSLSAADEDLRKLLNERAELKKTIAEMEQNILDINNLLNKIKNHLKSAPAFAEGLRKALADWLVNDAIGKTEDWLHQLKNTLERWK